MYANYAIKEATTDKNNNVNLEANLMAHALLGAIEAYATGNNAAAGAAGAVSGELAAKVISEQLYQKSPEQLTEAQKQTVTALSQLASGLAGGLISDSAAGAINAAEIGKRAVEDNFPQPQTYLKLIHHKFKPINHVLFVNAVCDHHFGFMHFRLIPHQQRMPIR